MASMTDLKKRKSSIESTGQITKAMKLVSTVKLQKARQKAEDSKPYFDFMYDTTTSILKLSEEINHPFTCGNGCKKKAVVVITSNRGLAGGYNSNIVRKVTEDPSLDKKDVVIYPVGRKGKELLMHKGYEMGMDFSDSISAPIYADAYLITKMLINDYREEKIGEIHLVYSRFVNTVTQEPRSLQLLPVDPKQHTEDVDANTLMNYEMEEQEALEEIVPKYIASLIYGALSEALASENGARMQAMDNATSNAEEMIEDLELEYNRVRQDSITQELTEIIAGANAIS